MKKEAIKWRLKEQPTSESLRELVKDKILTNEEAREILFSKETIEERDADSLRAEIGFLRSLVEKLSESRSQIITTIKEIQVPYKRWDWYKPYDVWCMSEGGTYVTTASNDTVLLSANGSAQTFSQINTFNN